MNRLVAVGLFGIAIAVGTRILFSRVAPDGDAIDGILRDMARQRMQFDPAQLNNLSEQEIAAAFRRMMDQSTDQIGPAPKRAFVRVTHYAPAWINYVGQLRDHARLQCLARLTVEGYQPGNAWADRGALLQASLHAICQTKDDSLIDLLAPLLDHGDWMVANDVMDELRSTREHLKYFASLYFKAMESKHPRVVEEALAQAPNCWDEPKRRPLRDALRKVYEGSSEELRFQSCFPLMFEFHDRKAIAYLVEQTRSNDKTRARTSVVWLGDVCNNRWPPLPGVIDAIKAHVDSPEETMRRAAARAVTTYSGREAIEVMVALLGSADPEVVKSVEWSLDHIAQPRHRDFTVLQEVLVQHRDATTNAALQQRCQELLDKTAVLEQM